MFLERVLKWIFVLWKQEILKNMFFIFTVFILLHCFYLFCLETITKFTWNVSIYIDILLHYIICYGVWWAFAWWTTQPCPSQKTSHRRSCTTYSSKVSRWALNSQQMIWRLPSYILTTSTLPLTVSSTSAWSIPLSPN